MNEQLRQSMADAAGVELDSHNETIGDALLKLMHACDDVKRKRARARRRARAWEHAIKIEVPR